MKNEKHESSPPLAKSLLAKLLISSLLTLIGLVLWGGVDLREIWMIVALVIALRLVWLIKALVHEERSRVDLAIEALSLLIVVPCAMALVLMLTNNIVAFTGVARWPIALSLMAAIPLHFGPALIRLPLLRGYYRLAIAAAMVTATAGVMQTKHPYLLATGSEKRRLVAEKVWNLGHTFEAARHADKLFAYGEDLVEEGRLSDAVIVYERGLAFDIYNDAARQRLAIISNRPEVAPQSDRHNRASSTALWVKPENVPPITPFPSVPPRGFSIVLVPCGTIPDGVLDRVAAEVSARVELPVYRYSTSVSLPPPDRSFGLLGNRQWHPSSLWTRFLATTPATTGSCQYILVTAEDLFVENTNFIFGTAVGLHGIVSFARFGDTNRPATADDLLIDRLSKQVLSTSIKGFGLASPTPGCVTSTSRSLQEFDRKAQTPSPAIHRDYLNAIRTLVAQSTNSAY